MKSNISDYIVQKRREHGLTQTGLAKAAGVGMRFMRELEQGKPTVQLNKVNQVLAYFGAELAPVRKAMDN